MRGRRNRIAPGRPSGSSDFRAAGQPAHQLIRYGWAVSVLTVYRVAFAAFLVAASVLGWNGVDVTVVLGLAVISALGFVLAVRLRPAWRTELLEIRRDPVRLRQETRKDLAYFGAFLVAIVAIEILVARGG